MIDQLRHPCKRNLGWPLKKRQQHSTEVLLQEYWSHTVPASGSGEALRPLIDGGKQTHDFLESSGCEEGLRQGIHRRPDLCVGRQCSHYAKRQGLQVEESGLRREDL